MSIQHLTSNIFINNPITCTYYFINIELILRHVQAYPKLNKIVGNIYPEMELVCNVTCNETRTTTFHATIDYEHIFSVINLPQDKLCMPRSCTANLSSFFPI